AKRRVLSQRSSLRSRRWRHRARFFFFFSPLLFPLFHFPESSAAEATGVSKRASSMEDSDMDNMGSLRPQTFLFGCELKGDKPYHFKVNDEENEHQLSLRTVSLGVGAKDELHVVEAEALDYEGNQIKVTLASLKMSVQPTEEPESESEDEDKVQQNMKKARMADKDFEDDDDDDDDDEEDDDEDEDEEEEEDKTPQKKPARDSSVKKTPKSKQNGKDSKLATPKLTTSKLKGMNLPKLEAKFANYIKSCYKAEDPKVIQELWQWRQSL
ncbi:Nucleophosmin, partial [Ophiophagus hannah]